MNCCPKYQDIDRLVDEITTGLAQKKQMVDKLRDDSLYEIDAMRSYLKTHKCRPTGGNTIINITRRRTDVVEPRLTGKPIYRGSQNGYYYKSNSGGKVYLTKPEVRLCKQGKLLKYNCSTH